MERKPGKQCRWILIFVRLLNAVTTYPPRGLDSSARAARRFFSQGPPSCACRRRNERQIIAMLRESEL